jgi:hypothetical protein
MPQIARVWICPPCSDLIDRAQGSCVANWLVRRHINDEDVDTTGCAVTRDRAFGCIVCFPNIVQLFSPRLKFGLDVLY